MGVHGGPKKTSKSELPIVLHYDMLNPKSYKGRPLTNYAYIQHARIDNTYATYEQTPTAPWPANHADAITVYNNSGTNITGYVNTGVTDYESTQHAIWVYNEELKRPVVSMRDWDSEWKAKNWVTGYSMTDMGLSSSDNYTISWLQWTTDTGKSANVGLYGHDNLAANGFHDGLAHTVDQTSTQNTETYKWERVHCTFTVASDWDFTYNLRCYMYGQYNPDGTLKIADVQIEPDSTVFSGFHGDSLTRSNTEALIDPISGTTITANSLTYLDHPNFEFNGSADYLTTGTIPAFTAADEFSVECIIKPDASATDMRFITPTGLGIDRWVGTNTSSKLQLTLCQSSDTGVRSFSSTTSISTSDYQHWIVTVNGTDINFYLNGDLDSNQTDSSGFAVGQWGGYTWYIGQRSNSTFWFDGEIPMVTAYDGVLTASQAKKNFLAVRKQYGI